MRRVLSLIFALGCAVLGAAAGRAVVRWREDTEAGREPSLDFESLRPTAREVLPGVVAALRVHDAPWSYLHIPSWLAAFAVNAALGALSKELGPILRAFGIETPEDEREPEFARAEADDFDPDSARSAGIVTSEVWMADRIPPTSAGSSQPAPGFRPFGT